MDRLRKISRDIGQTAREVKKAHPEAFNTMKGLLSGDKLFRKPADQSHQTDAGVFENVSVTTRDGLVTFKLSDIDTFTVEDLVNIPLSGYKEDLNIDTSIIDDSKINYNFPSDDIRVKLTMKRAMGVLKESYKYNTYKEFPDLHRSVLKAHIYLNLFNQIAGMNLDTENVTNFIMNSENAISQLLEHNKHKNQERRNQGKDQPKVDNTYQKEKLKRQHVHPEAKFFFSNDDMKRGIANQIAVTRAYYRQFPKERGQQPDTEAFHIAYAGAENIFQVDLKASSSDDLVEFRETIDTITGKFKGIAEQNREQFRSALKDEIARARMLNDWAANFTTRFDLHEDWVKAGMEQLGIKEMKFDESYSKLLANPHITNETFDNRAVSDIVEGYQADKIVQAYEDFVRANVNLGYIHSQLKEGIPVSGIPKRMLGREVIEVSGDMNDCLPRALLKGAYPNWPKPFLEMYVGKAKQHVMQNINEPGRAVHDTENPEVLRANQLNLGGDAGQILIEYLRSPYPLPGVKNSLLDPERRILGYQYRDEKIQCVEDIAGSSAKPPYAVLRDHYSLQSGHYWAIRDKT